MRPRWTAQDTVQLVHEKFGHEQRAIAEPPLRAIERRVGFAVYHTTQVLHHFNASDATVLQGRSFGDLLFDEELTARHHDAQYAMAAHVMAAMENLCAVPELLSAAVFHSLKLAEFGVSPFLEQTDITFQNVLGVMRHLPHCRVVAPAMHALKSAPTHKYLEALVLESRSNAVISASVIFDATSCDSEPYRLRIQAFRHKGEDFGARDVDPLLLDEGRRVQRAVADTLLAVGECLRGPSQH